VFSDGLGLAYNQIGPVALDELEVSLQLSLGSKVRKSWEYKLDDLPTTCSIALGSFQGLILKIHNLIDRIVLFFLFISLFRSMFLGLTCPCR